MATLAAPWLVLIARCAVHDFISNTHKHALLNFTVPGLPGAFAKLCPLAPGLRAALPPSSDARRRLALVHVGTHLELRDTRPEQLFQRQSCELTVQSSLNHAGEPRAGLTSMHALPWWAHCQSRRLPCPNPWSLSVHALGFDLYRKLYLS